MIQIGYTHGSKASLQISRSIAFYADLFQESAHLDWAGVSKLALDFQPSIEKQWPDYLEEMRGVAEGAAVDLPSIIALNVRTEITFGLFSDGCTALSWRPPNTNTSYLAQNWDWMTPQQQNLIILNIQQTGKPAIKMVTEAGLIGKIGLNSAGVGVCLNAIKAAGVSKERIPCHLGLRKVLDSWSCEEAVQALEKTGVASSCHMLVADPTGGIGLEWSSIDCVKVHMNDKGQVFHTNHYLLPHAKGVHDTNWLKDSNFRVKRIEELCGKLDGGGAATGAQIASLFTDEKNAPNSICREQTGDSKTGTLFNIVMELGGSKPRARVVLGRPTEPEEVVDLVF